MQTSMSTTPTQSMTEAAATTVVGVDGCKSGWIACWRSASRRLQAQVYADATALLAAHRDARVIGVDVPIGLSEHGPRASDALARQVLGGHRASSIFSAPVRGVLHARTQAEASALHKAIDGRGFGVQSFGILPKIREWDDALAADATAPGRVREVHPELSFAAMNAAQGGDGKGLVASKKSDDGHAQRIALLARHFPRRAIERLLADRASGVGRDDLIDALAVLWSAQRIERAQAHCLPPTPVRDRTGLASAIWV